MILFYRYEYPGNVLVSIMIYNMVEYGIKYCEIFFDKGFQEGKRIYAGNGEEEKNI